MPLYEGPDFSLPLQTPIIGQPLAPTVPAETTQTHTFESDLEDFKRGAGAVLKHADLLDEPPEGTVRLSNYRRFPLGQIELERINQSRLGYPLYLVDRVFHGGDKPTPNEFAGFVPVDPAARQTVPGVSADHAWEKLRASNLNPKESSQNAYDADQYEEALHVLLDMACDTNAYWFDYDPKYNKSSYKPLDYTAMTFKLIEATQPTLIQRGFMTNMLHKVTGFGDIFKSENPERMDRYEQLLDEGVRPLGYEELLGLSMRHIRYHIKHDPTYPKPPSAEPEDL